jgi:hypothetical protein
MKDYKIEGSRLICEGIVLTDKLIMSDGSIRIGILQGMNHEYIKTLLKAYFPEYIKGLEDKNMLNVPESALNKLAQ